MTKSTEAASQVGGQRQPPLGFDPFNAKRQQASDLSFSPFKMRAASFSPAGTKLLLSPAGSTVPAQAAPVPAQARCPAPLLSGNVLAAALLLFCRLIPPSGQRLGPFSGRAPISRCSQPRQRHSHCLWKSGQSPQTKVPRAG